MQIMQQLPSPSNMSIQGKWTRVYYIFISILVAAIRSQIGVGTYYLSYNLK